MKTKEYIKSHLAKYRGKSFCGSRHFFPDEADYRRRSDAFRLTRYFYNFLHAQKIPLSVLLRSYIEAAGDFLWYFIPILKNSKETLDRLGNRYPFRTLLRQEVLISAKVMFAIRYLICLPWRFFIFSLTGRETWIGNYGRPSKLLRVCRYNIFQITKSAGPAGCYCYEDVWYLCREKNLKLAKSMRRYFAPEEYFCQTLLYNSETHRRNFLNENLCATNYQMRDFSQISAYLYREKFVDSLFYDVPKNYQFDHICFLRKISDLPTYRRIRSILSQD